MNAAVLDAPGLPESQLQDTVCFAGMLINRWTVGDFYPIEYISRGAQLTPYSGGAGDLPADLFQSFLDEIAAGRLDFPVGGVFSLEQIAEAHQAMDDGAAVGKLVVVE